MTGEFGQTDAAAGDAEDFRHFIELGPQMPWTADAKGNVLTASSRWTDLTGLPVEATLGTGWLTVVHPEDLEAALGLIDAALRDSPNIDKRLRFRSADESYRWMRVQAFPRRGATGEILRWYGLTEDIHEQVQAEQRLAESEEHHRYTVELSPQIPWTADPDGNITEIGPRWFALTGMKRARALGSGWSAAVHPQDLDALLDLWSACVEAGARLDVKYRLRIPPGGYRWFRARAQPRRDASGTLVRWYGVLEDIDDQVRAEIALQQAEERYRLATQATNDLIWDWDLTSGQLRWTQSDQQRFGFRTEDLGSTTAWWQKRIHPDDRLRVLQTISQRLASSETQLEHEYRFRRADGTYASVMDRAFIVRDADSSAIRIVGAMQDLSDRKRAEEEVIWSATHDGLTELPNRRLFNERLQQALTEARARQGSVGLLHLDVDHFKQVNDALGHDAGDELLKTLATRLRLVIRSGDTIARLGGDEFALILPDVAGPEDISVLVGALLARMREPFNYHGRILDCRVSVGASVYPRHGDTPEELLKNADIALYMAKSEARGGLVLFDNEMRNTMQKRSAMIAVAREAIRDDRVVPYYQAKVDLADRRRIIGFEALLRWRDRQRGIQLPKMVEAAFEDLNVAAAISDRMIERTIEDMCRWLDRGIEFGHVAVNAAAAEFRRDDFAERVLAALAKAQVPTSCFQLEVTETVFLGRGAEYVDRALKLLSQNGVKIALDDFGTGYASLRHLKQFPVDIIKVDRSFVRGMTANSEDEAIIRAVVNLGRSLDISIVAEGIETEDQHRALARLGCSFGQGFLYSKAIPRSRVPALLATRLEEADTPLVSRVVQEPQQARETVHRHASDVHSEARMA